MDPYDVMGCSSSTPMEEIETAYRLLLRQHHPDLHHAEGPAAVATAEHTTRALNLAMSEIRARHQGHRPQSSYAPGDRGRRGGGFGGYRYTGPDPWQTSGRRPHDADREPPHWMGEPIQHAPDEPVPCPYCGAGFYELDEFKAHMADRHHFHAAAERVPLRDRPPPKPVIVLGKLRYVPSSLVALMVLFLMIIHAPPWLWLSAMVFLCLVMWAQTSKLVRRRGNLR